MLLGARATSGRGFGCGAARLASKTTKRERERQRNAQLARNAAQAAAKKLGRWKHLAEPAKHKRVLSLCDHWFSAREMPDDSFILDSMSQCDGWMPIEKLLTFPRMQGWCDASTVQAAIAGTGGVKKYQTAVVSGRACFRPRRFGSEYEIAKSSLQPPEKLRGEQLVRHAAALWASRPRPQRSAREPSPPTTSANLPQFVGGSQGKVRVLESVESTNAFCDALLHSLPADGTRLAAVGLDVESATLEEDLRMLPALLSICTLECTALLRLHKLPEHGRRLLHASPPLVRLLETEDVLKVGVGIHSDVSSLLSWCADSADTRHVHFSPARVLDLNELCLPREWPSALAHVPGYLEAGPPPRSLAEWTECVLQQRLPKRKFKGRKGGKASKKAHWRAPHLTDDMRRYAANDAAAGLAVWRVLQEHVGEEQLLPYEEYYESEDY